MFPLPTVGFYCTVKALALSARRPFGPALDDYSDDDNDGDNGDDGDIIVDAISQIDS